MVVGNGVGEKWRAVRGQELMMMVIMTTTTTMIIFRRKIEMWFKMKLTIEQ